VTSETAEALWQERTQYFFKPAAGFGSRAAYRCEKLTRRVWPEVLTGDYIAQTCVLPTVRAVTVGDERLSLKYDVRIYTDGGGRRF